MGRRRKRERRERTTKTAVAKATQPIHNMPLYEVVNEDGLDRIEEAAWTIVEEVGIDFYDEEMIGVLQDNGVVVKDQTAYFDRTQILEHATKAPSSFTQLARNPDRQVEIGGKKMCFAPVYGPPFVYDMDRGRREAKLVDFENFIKLAYMNPYIHHSGGTIVEPSDEPVHTRHLDMVYAHMKWSDKPFMGSVTSEENALDTIEMCKILYGAEAIEKNPATISLINISSPRRLDDRMLGALKAYAKANQALIITPFLLSGAMGPVSVAGTAAQLHAETMAGLALIQMIRPGCPTIYGSFQSGIDLQSGAPVFGSSAAQQALYITAQFARRYNLPVRSGGMFASSKISDAQAAYESVMSMQPAILGRVNFVLHAAGWLEAGLTAGYEKFVMDCEMLGAFHKFLEGVDLSDDALALDSQRTVPAGGHHLGTDHTMRHFRTAFYRNGIFDYNSAEQWLEEGGKDIQEIANAKYKKLLSEYKAPPLDPVIDSALNDFMTRRKTEIQPEY